MTTFILLAIALCLLTFIFLGSAFLQPKRLNTSNRKEQNVLIAKERLAHLETEYNAGHLTKANYTEAKAEVESELLADVDSLNLPTEKQQIGKISLILISLFCFIGAGLLYQYKGKPKYITLQGAGAGFAKKQQEQIQKMDDLLARLAQKMTENPNNVEGWFLLGRSYHSLARYQDSADALEKAYQLSPKNVDIMIMLADSLMMLNQPEKIKQTENLIKKALEVDPNHPQALWLSAVVAENNGQFQQAINYYQRLLPLAEKESPQDAITIKRQLSALQQKAGIKIKPMVQPIETISTNDKTAIKAQIKVEISLDPALADKVKPTDSLFIYAVATQGPKMPLAAIRTTAGDLPLTLVLDDSHAMMPQMKISNFKQVKVGARISAQGGAIKKRGDLEGEVSPVTVGSNAVIQIIIQHLIP